jgi:hypothetical protein
VQSSSGAPIPRAPRFGFNGGDQLSARQDRIVSAKPCQTPPHRPAGRAPSAAPSGSSAPPMRVPVPSAIGLHKLGVVLRLGKDAKRATHLFLQPRQMRRPGRGGIAKRHRPCDGQAVMPGESSHRHRERRQRACPLPWQGVRQGWRPAPQSRARQRRHWHRRSRHFPGRAAKARPRSAPARAARSPGPARHVDRCRHARMALLRRGHGRESSMAVVVMSVVVMAHAHHVRHPWSSWVSHGRHVPLGCVIVMVMPARASPIHPGKGAVCFQQAQLGGIGRQAVHGAVQPGVMSGPIQTISPASARLAAWLGRKLEAVGIGPPVQQQVRLGQDRPSPAPPAREPAECRS